jgi:hypothetical protein
MKKIFSIALLLVLIITMCCSCGKKEPQTGTISSIDCFDNAGFATAIEPVLPEFFSLKPFS